MINFKRIILTNGKGQGNNLVDYEDFSRKTLFSLNINVRSKWTFDARNVGQGSGL